jgi:hypothetical protein
MIIFCV